MMAKEKKGNRKPLLMTLKQNIDIGNTIERLTM
jgi:hypothetical protein